MLTTNSRRVKPQSKMPAILSVAYTLMSGAYMAGLMFVEIPQQNQAAVLLAVGQLMALVNLAAGYYLGSTSGSKNKDELLSQSVPVQRQDDQ